MQHLEQLRVVGLIPLYGAQVDVEVDEYIPLRIRTYVPPLGAQYVRLGDYRKSLLGVVLEDGGHVVRGLTLTSFEGLSGWPDVDLAAAASGVPVLAVDALTVRYGITPMHGTRCTNHVLPRAAA